ncbi:protein FAM193A isoform X2 [Lingula anatina]|uniref:Protein FAM193A isoform X2 n=1 Tax=Lingula anatina TaxID=7574 RepID=A0A1S3IC67_LINAN|nr:protein FAM193A isoform X2 [Lingula anatina]|eukprot:XP_013395019.1 protein FAM193A isoform X2 [Lingula anatina]
MSFVDARKSKKRKSRKGTRSANTSSNQINQPNISHLKQEDLEEMKEIERLMDAGEDSDDPVPNFSRGPNPYLGGERCLLCRCERPSHLKEIEEANKESEKEKAAAMGLTQLPLWVCPECRKTVEEEEKKAGIDTSFLEQELRMDANQPFTLTDSMLTPASEPTTPNGTLCTCEACTERREIENEHHKETQELQQCWMEVRHVVRCVYRQAGTGLEENENEGETEALPDLNKMKDLVHRLCLRDPHQLFQRLESQAREYVIEMKVRLLKQLNQGQKTPAQAKQFVSMLLEEYSNLCKAAKTISSFMTELETEHLKKFNLTWELHNKHLLHSIIYSDPLVQNNLPMLLTQLRLGAASKESYHEDTYPNLLHSYLKFDNELSVVSVVWRDCQHLMEEYNEEQSALKAKQKMLKEDWEFFKAQRKLLEQQVLKNNTSKTQQHNLEVQFTETMKTLLAGPKPQATEMHVECPNCHRKRCSCDECTISHMITCGIISPEVSDGMNTHLPLPLPHYDPSRYVIDVDPPSVSSTTSSSGSSSPIIVDPERLTLPFDENQDNSDNEEYVEASETQDTGGQDSKGEEGDDEAEDDDDEGEDDDDDDEDNEEDEDEEEEGQEKGEMENVSGVKTADVVGESPDQWSNPVPKSGDGVAQCSCPQCLQAQAIAQRARAQAQLEQKKLEENQCQCHACLQQLGKTIPTSLPQPPVSMTNTPASFNLYPHIHGSNSLQGLAGPQAVRPFLHPQLYDLHTPLQHFPKPIIQPQKKQPLNLNLDLDSQEALHEHIYNAYSEWDNVYDHTNFMFPHAKFGSSLGSELLNGPPPPLLNANTFLGGDQRPPFSIDQNVFSSPSKASAPHSTVGNSKTSLAAPMPTLADHVAQKENCFKNLKPINRTTFNQPVSKAPQHPNLASPAGMSFGGKVDPGYLDHCLKHSPTSNPFSVSHFPLSNTTNTFTSVPASSASAHQLSLESMKLPVLPPGTAEELVSQAFGAGLNLNLPHPCNHLHNNNNTGQGLSKPPPPTAGMDSSGMYGGPLGNSAAMNNVSVGTSTGCADPECDGHHDDTYDEDSCSEQSSSTSTSNQKDGKYCDCCYCEFFGHGNPPNAPTSKNFLEMRDRLRLKLKRKNEYHPDREEREECQHQEIQLLQQQPHKQEPAQPQPHEDPVTRMGLEELVNFINGGDSNGEKQLSAKAAKRARQKQKKAEERARKLAEQQEREKEQKRKEELEKQQQQQQRQLQLQQQQQQQQQQNVRKKKNKLKDTSNQQQDTSSSAEQKAGSQITPAEPTTTEKPEVPKLSKQNNKDKQSKVQQGKSKVTTTNEINTIGTGGEALPQGKARKNKSKPGQQESKGNQSSDTTVAKIANGQIIQEQQQQRPAKQQHGGKQQQVQQQQHGKLQQQPQETNNKTPQSMVCNQKLQQQQQQQKQLSKNQQQQQLDFNHQQKQVPQATQSPRIQQKSKQGVNDKGQLMNGKVSPTSGQEETSPSNNQTKSKSKKKKKSAAAAATIDEIFMPKQDLDLDNGDMDEYEKELEEFKRFCLDSKPAETRAKLQVNVNFKDLLNKGKKSSSISCS